MKKSVLILGVLLWTPLNGMQVAQLSTDTSREIALVLEQKKITEDPSESINGDLT